MNRMLLTKLSGMLVSAILLTLVLGPISAAAEPNPVRYKNLNYATNTVTGTVYSDHALGSTIDLAVYSNVNGDVYELGTVTTRVYTIVDGVYEYNFYYYVQSDVYNPVQFAYEGNIVSEYVYRSPSPPGDPTSPVSPTTPVNPPASNDTNTVINGVTALGNVIPEAALTNGFKDRDQLDIKTEVEFVSLEASGLLEPAKREGSSITISNVNGEYELPLSLLDFDSLAEELGVAPGSLKIIVSIKPATADETNDAEGAADELGADLESAVVDFELRVEGGGKSITLSDFGNKYVKRSIPTSTTDSSATGVVYNPATGEFSFVPSYLSGGEMVIQKPGNSLYTVVNYDKNFTDTANHWARADIKLLADKLIVFGNSETTYNVKGTLTRAELAALVTRSLGLDKVATSSFSDVSASSWYNGVVGAAVKAGLMEGTNGRFSPNALVDREEFVSVLVKALEFVGQGIELSAAEQASILSQFTDSGDIDGEKTSFAVAVKAGIVLGNPDDTLTPDRPANRAEAAALLKRFLTLIGFI